MADLIDPTTDHAARTPGTPGAPGASGAAGASAGVPADPVETLLGRMSLREKVGQLNQRLYGWRAVERVGARWRVSDELRAEIDRWGGLGLLYGLHRADAWSGRDWATGVLPHDRPEVSALVVDTVRAACGHGLGPLLVEEVPHGHQALGSTLLPVALATGATWDPDRYHDAAAAVAAQARADGVHLALVSALDLLRDPRWGRSEECFGEVPALAAAMARAVVLGMQGPARSRLADGTGVGVVLKHFVAQGEGVGGRNGHPAHLGPHDLADLHLPAARAGVAAGAVGVMAAYNDVDSVPCIGDRALLTDLLRGDWGFDGLVMADGLAVDRLREQTGSLVAAAALALTAGVDVSLWDRAWTHLEEVVDRAPHLGAAVDAACRRVLRLKAAFGLVPGVPGGAQGHPVDAAGRERLQVAAAAAARRLAEAGPVLLGDTARPPVLPMPPGTTWAVTGPRADDAECLLGDYVPALAPAARVPVAQALVDRAPGHGVQVLRVPAPDPAWLARCDGVVVVLGGSSHRTPSQEFAANGAAAGATAADCGEGVDLAAPVLPAGQVQQLAAVREATTGPVVAVVVAGRPYVLTEVLALADAVLVVFYPGPQGGEVVADLLLGAVQPTGRLPAQLPAHPAALPVRHDERMGADGVYRDVPAPVLAPVGAGVGYGRVRLAGCTVRAGAHGDAVVHVHLRADAGPWPGVEVVRVHARREGGVRWPRTTLAGFARVEVPAGTDAHVQVPLPAAAVRLPAAEVAPLAVPRTRLTVHVGDQVHDLDLDPMPEAR